ncbi:beta-N-acetylglucosaminidase domain-containing protein [Carnobacteriaceae bacterium zg-C25]|nr:beta-N-acetylglucosaminidase domain-containing protein [Carnobacteriaceae bacterium zg-C25]
MNKIIKWISAICVMFLCIIGSKTIHATENTYQFYPTVQNATYQEENLSLNNQTLSLYFGNGIDEETKVYARQLLAEHHIAFQEVTQKVDDGISLNVEITDTQENLFSHWDAYSLNINATGIHIIGKHKDAAYFGLTTLHQILTQSTNQTVRYLTISDYADVKYRGFIEGYYGIPWSHENRQSLMRFAGQFKANTYIFAPKDDIYHSQQWKALYPEEKLSQIRELVEVGKLTKTRFVWTIHPFMSGARFNFSQYEENYNYLINKFEQLYTTGVRQFGILADDVGSIDRNQLLRLLNDISQWAKDKGDVEDILFCPAGYNTAFQGNFSEMKKLNEAPDNIQFFWTGETVVNRVTNQTINRFKTSSTTDGHPGRAPYFWLNWPVNDYKKSRLLMGPAGTLLETGVTDLAGLVTNPMQQAQASKVGIFATINYGWNTHHFSSDDVWHDGMAYIEKNQTDALLEITRHLQDVSPSGHGLVMEESAMFKDLIASYQQAVGNGTSVKEIGAALIQKYQVLYQATQDFLNGAENEGLKEEMAPWVNTLANIAQASQSFIESAIALEDNNTEKAWLAYSKAVTQEELSKTHTVQNISSVDKVEAGAKRLTPFMQFLKEKMADKVKRIVLPQDDDTPSAPEAPTLIKSSHFNNIYQGSEASMLDNNPNTFVWYSIAGNSLPRDAYLGIDLHEVYRIGEISFLQGTTSNDDIFKNAVLEYSVDGVTYQPFTDTLYNQKDVRYDATQQNIKARYIRLKNGGNTEKWAAMREINVATVANQQLIETNVESLKELPAQQTAQRFTLNPKAQVTLQPNEYIGLDLQRIRSLKRVTIEHTSQLPIYVGMNRDDLKPYTLETVPNVRYIVIKNTTDSPVTFDIQQFNVETNDVLPLKVKDTNFTDMENPLAAFDGDWNTKAWFKNSQLAGKYVVYDLGQTITLDKIKQIVSDSEHDYIRHGKISVSENGTDFTDVLTLGDTENDLEIEGVYPDREVQVLGKSANVNHLPVRYIKVMLTKNKSGDDKWVRFNEIVLNDREELKTSNNPTFDVTPAVSNADRPENMVDKHLNTAFRGSQAGGELHYHLSQTAFHNTLTVIQNDEVSHTKVSVQNREGYWQEIGELTGGINTFNLKDKGDIVTVKLTWQENNRPVIYEMYTTDGINRLPLQNLLKEIATLNENDYAEGFPALIEKVTEANRVLQDDEATTEQITQMVQALQEKINQLKKYHTFTSNASTDVVVKIPEDDAIKDLEMKIESATSSTLDETHKEYDLYDIYFVKKGTTEKVAVTQPAKVTLNVKENKTVAEIVYINEQDEKESLPFDVMREENKVVFQATHFSKYGVVYTSSKPDEPEENKTEGNKPDENRPDENKLDEVPVEQPKDEAPTTTTSQTETNLTETTTLTTTTKQEKAEDEITSVSTNVVSKEMTDATMTKQREHLSSDSSQQVTDKSSTQNNRQKEQSKELPDTGEQNHWVQVVLGSGLLLLGIGIILYIRRKK